MTQRFFLFIILCWVCLVDTRSVFADSNVIEEQLKEIGSVPNEEVVVVERKYTRKRWRHEFSPVQLGGVPFGNFRRTLFGGAGYTLHVNDWLAWEVGNFIYTKTFFSSFTDDVNVGQAAAGRSNINIDYQKLLFIVTSGLQISPMYGKLSTFSRFIAYMEPYLSLTAGLARTEARDYFSFAPGIGLRIFFREWFSMRFEFRDYIYSEKNVDKTTGAETTSTRNNYAAIVSLSFWLPKMPGE